MLIAQKANPANKLKMKAFRDVHDTCHAGKRRSNLEGCMAMKALCSLFVFLIAVSRVVEGFASASVSPAARRPSETRLWLPATTSFGAPEDSSPSEESPFDDPYIVGLTALALIPPIIAFFVWSDISSMVTFIFDKFANFQVVST